MTLDLSFRFTRCAGRVQAAERELRAAQRLQMQEAVRFAFVLGFTLAGGDPITAECHFANVLTSAQLGEAAS